MGVDRDRTWLKRQKYGQGVKKIYKHETKLGNFQWTTPLYINYNYSKAGGRGRGKLANDDINDNTSWERIPTRQLKICDPKDYAAHAAYNGRSKKWLNTR